MIDSTHTPEAPSGEPEAGGTIGQALDRIVGAPARAPVVKKKLDFPRESVRASSFEVNRAILEEPSKAGEVALETANGAAEPKVDPAKFQDPDLPYDEVVGRPEEQMATPVVPVNGGAHAGKPGAKPVPQEVSPKVVEPVPAVPPSPVAAQVPAQVEKEDAIPATAKAPVAEEAVEEVPAAPAPKVIVQRKAVPAKARAGRIVGTQRDPVPQAKPTASVAELDLFMRENEKVEERAVQCRPETWAKLQEISKRTGCSPSDLASQAVMGVAAAIREAGFEFSLPMSVEYTRRG